MAELSGGERQRAYLAMVLAQETEYLLLDEPAASLDIAHQIEIMELLKQLSSDGRGIVITSHDLPQSAAYCDRICVIDRGRAALAIPAAGAGGKNGNASRDAGGDADARRERTVSLCTGQMKCGGRMRCGGQM